MKRFELLIVVLFLLSGCGQKILEVDIPTETDNGAQIEKENLATASLLSAKPQKPSLSDEQITDIQIREAQKIGKEVPVSEADIRRGFYYGTQDEKRYGTPVSWIWVSDGDKSRWSSAEAEKLHRQDDMRQLCKGTDGEFTESCIDSERMKCDFESETGCACPEETIWNPKEGCLRIDIEGKLVLISNEDVQRGWYAGTRSQKKKGTPINWIWGNDRWQSPPPILD